MPGTTVCRGGATARGGAAGSRGSRSAARSRVFAIWAIADNERLFFITLLNGLTLGSLYFIVASGFTLVFGLMRNVNLAHGSLYLLGGYIGFFVAERSGSWLLAVAAGFAVAAVVGLVMQLLIFRRMPGEDLRQTMVTIGLSIVIADLLIWYYGAQVHQMEPPALLAEPLRGLPVLRTYSSYRLFLLPLGIAIGVLLWLFLNRTRVGMMIRAGVDDRGMLVRLRREREPRVRDHVRDRRGTGRFRRRHRRRRAVDGAGRGHAAAARIAGRRDRRRHGQRRRRCDRGRDSRARRDVRARLCADLQRRVHVPDPRARACVPAARHPGRPREPSRRSREAGPASAREAWVPLAGTTDA